MFECPRNRRRRGVQHRTGVRSTSCSIHRSFFDMCSARSRGWGAIVKPTATPRRSRAAAGVRNGWRPGEAPRPQGVPSPPEVPHLRLVPPPRPEVRRPASPARRAPGGARRATGPGESAESAGATKASRAAKVAGTAGVVKIAGVRSPSVPSRGASGSARGSSGGAEARPGRGGRNPRPSRGAGRGPLPPGRRPAPERTRGSVRGPVRGSARPPLRLTRRGKATVAAVVVLLAFGILWLCVRSTGSMWPIGSV
ncbi:hypothetical protein FHS43_004483 [Streptosporangium becharense]|uniref:Uncharacterized protein n=1 Tax=Streptosporangium becharense TaxID=1816182 RepID=A0A7W9IJZ7_9ACTN|nr:hypothetical protein [Streptosporangium becharense]MBB5822168.1 hypothetical protein [Streptosporangium becharense]